MLFIAPVRGIKEVQYMKYLQNITHGHDEGLECFTCVYVAGREVLEECRHRYVKKCRTKTWCFKTEGN